MAHNRKARRGLILIYVMILFTALCAFVSLGVEYGRVQLVKAELERAAHAAARAAASQLPNGVTAAQNAAVTWGAYNTADGSPVIIDPNNDVEFGTWDPAHGTFTLLTGSARSSANAIRVSARRTTATGNAIPLIFGPVVGMSTCNANGQDIASMENGQPYGIVGVGSMNMNTTGVWDSYVSSAGAYSAGSARQHASAASNGTITLSSSVVNGDARGNTTVGGVVSGSRLPLTSALSYPSVSAGSYTTSNSNALLPAAQFDGTDFSQSGGVSTIPGGTYYIRNFVVTGNATVNMTGPVVMYVYGSANISANLIAYQSRPANFNMQLFDTATLQLRNSATVYGDIYGPDTAMSFSSFATVYGRVIAAQLQQSGNGSIHQDESLGPVGGNGLVTTVR